MSNEQAKVYNFIGSAHCGEYSDCHAFVVKINREAYAQIVKMRETAEDNDLTYVQKSSYLPSWTIADEEELLEILTNDPDEFDSVNTINQDCMVLSVSAMGFGWEGYEKHCNDELSTPFEYFTGDVWKELKALFGEPAAEVVAAAKTSIPVNKLPTAGMVYDLLADLLQDACGCNLEADNPEEDNLAIIAANAITAGWSEPLPVDEPEARTDSWIATLKPGDRVTWNDPDDGLCSRTVAIKSIEIQYDEDTGDIEHVAITDVDGSDLECLPDELEQLEQEDEDASDE